MYAITVQQPGKPDVLTWEKAENPTIGPGDVLIDIAATAVNRADLLQRQGFYPPPTGASSILGLECSGTIVDVGDAVQDWKVGDTVCALLAGGGYAEKVSVPAGQVLPVPQGVSLVDAAALPEVACTVWSNITMKSRLMSGEILLIHGGAGGIGTHAIQIGKALGATVITTAGSAERVEQCRSFGADVAINYREQDFVSEIKENFGGADVILDNMGASYLDKNVKVLNTGGRLAIIGLQGGTKSSIDLGKLLSKRVSIFATTLRSRSIEEKTDIVSQVREHVWPLITRGLVRPVIDRVLPLTEAARAHADLEQGGILGKIVLSR